MSRPVRGASAPTTKTDAPVRASRASKPKAVEPEVTETPKAGKAKAKTKEELPTSGKTVKKFLLVEKVKEYLTEVNPDLNAKIFDIAEKEVKDAEQNKGKVCFATFSTGAEVDDEENKAAMLEILWHYHTQPWKGRGKPMVIEVLPADKDNAAIIVFQELN